MEGLAIRARIVIEYEIPNGERIVRDRRRLADDDHLNLR
jgi:hypothetical protein